MPPAVNDALAGPDRARRAAWRRSTSEGVPSHSSGDDRADATWESVAPNDGPKSIVRVVRDKWRDDHARRAVAPHARGVAMNVSGCASRTGCERNVPGATNDGREERANT